MHRPTIAILFGGCSEEHEVSVRSAVEIAAAIDTARFDPRYVGITKTGEWLLCDGPGPGWDEGARRRVVISPDRTTHGLVPIDGVAGRPVHVDAVFPVLHGRTGEDGSIQGLLELAGIPYVGCDVQSSAICMDKSLTYLVASAAGIATPTFSVVHAGTPLPSELDGPVFVKPARSGSSFGVAKVEQVEQLRPAIQAARAYDTKVLIEAAVVGCEVGCGVLGDVPDLVVGEVDQIRLRHGFFRIHQEEEPEKGSENASIRVPAELVSDDRTRIQQVAKDVYTALGCRGLARVDLFLQDDGRIVLNEVNTLPGFTAYSRYPRMMAEAGIDLTEVIDRSIALALAR